MPYSRGTCLALLGVVLLPAPAVAAGSRTDPALITALAAEASQWGLGSEHVERTSKYHTVIGAAQHAEVRVIAAVEESDSFRAPSDLSPATFRFDGPSAGGIKSAAWGTSCKTKLPGTKAG